MKKQFFLPILTLAFAIGFFAPPVGAQIGLRQVWTSKAPSLTATASTRYNNITGADTWETVQNGGRWCFPDDVTVENLKIRSSAAPGAAISAIFTASKDTVATTLTCTITGAVATTCEDTINTVSYAAGTCIELTRTTSGGSPATAIIDFSVETISDDPAVSINGSQMSIPSNTVTNFQAIMGEPIFEWQASSGPTTRGTWAVTGTATNARAYVNNAPGAGNSYTFNIIKNQVVQDGAGGTANTTMVIEESSTTEVASFSLALSPFDRLEWQSVPASTPAAAVVGLSFRFVSTIAGQAVMMVTNPVSATTADRFGGFAGSQDWNATETNVSNIGGITAFTISGVHAIIGSPNDGRVVAVRENAADTAVIATFAGGLTTASDTAHTVIIDPASLFAVRTNGSEVEGTYYGLMQFDVVSGATSGGGLLLRGVGEDFLGYLWPLIQH